MVMRKGVWLFGTHEDLMHYMSSLSGDGRQAKAGGQLGHQEVTSW